MEIHIVTTATDFDALQQSWESLTDGNTRYGIFNSYMCNRLWWAHHQHLGILSIVVASDNGQIVGIAPLYRLQTHRLRKLQLETLSFLGRGASTTPDDLDLIVADNNREAITRELLQHILASDSVQRLHLRDLPTDSYTKTALQQMLTGESGTNKAPFRTMQMGDPVARASQTLPDSWQDYLSAQSRNFRKQVKRRNNRLQRSGDARFRLCRESHDIDKAAQALIKLHHARWENKVVEHDESGSESFKEPSYLAFHNDLMQALAAKDQLWLMTFELNDEVVGVEYAFEYNKRLSLFQTGFDPEQSQLAPGHLMMARLIEMAIDAGVQELDLLKGDYEYKDSYASEKRFTVDVDVVQGPVVTSLYRLMALARQTKDICRRLLKTVIKPK